MTSLYKSSKIKKVGYLGFRKTFTGLWGFVFGPSGTPTPLHRDLTGLSFGTVWHAAGLRVQGSVFGV